MSLSDLVSSAVSSDRIDPARSNLSLMASEFLTNSDWQHGDVFNKLLQTIVMAFVGTLFACLLAFPLAFIAARNITRNRPLNWITKRFFDFTRSVDMLIWALVFVRGFGPGPLAGISAIFVTDTGTFGKLYSEALENIDDKQREGVKSVGAGPMSIQRYGVVPQVLPIFASIERLDARLLEASADLGSSRVATFFQVTLPLTVPGVVAGCLFVFVPSFGNYVVPQLLGGGRRAMIGNLIERQFLSARDWPFGAALATGLIAITVLLLLGQAWLLRRERNRELAGG
jgi:ABC-type phosphate/phosphonate transport system permease subunit